MGENKAFLQVNGRSLIDHALRQAKSVSDDILIVGPKESYGAYGRIVTDVFPEAGPLGGIHAALGRSKTELNLMLALDTPFIQHDFLAYLVERAVTTDAEVTVPKVDGRFQPLCAVYRKTFHAAAEAALKAGERKIDRLFTPERTVVIELEKSPAFDSEMFANLNSREDYERALKQKSKANHS